MKYLTILILAILIPQSPLFFAQNGKTEKFDDWFLPSQDEIAAMDTNLNNEGVGGFRIDRYWSSSESTSESAHEFEFEFDFGTNNVKTLLCRVRACRSFTAASEAYSLRGTGPAGGLIFYIDGTTFYEAAPSDQTSSRDQAWSNVTATLIGTTGTAIGTGAQNTLDIIGQTSHTSSAAKLCNDLIIYN